VDRATAIFVEGIGAAAATSGVLSQLQGKIFALLYLEPRPLSLDEIAAALHQSKSSVSVNVRALVDWHLVRRVRLPGSRRDHYEAATDFWRVMQEIMERRFRWNLRQLVAAAEEARRAVPAGRRRRFVLERLDALAAFARALDAGIGGFVAGRSLEPGRVQRAGQVVPIRPPDGS
jgi:DNA-binding transcriptional regulator GbsR (MarR family)